METRFGPLDWLIIIVYTAMMVAIGAFFARKHEDADSYFLGNRQMPVWAVALSVMATSLSAATFIGVPQIAYDGDLTYLITNIGGMLSAFIVAFVIFPPLYRAGTITIYGYLGQRFGEPSMIAASAMFLLGRLLASGARLFIAAIAVSLIVYGNIQTSSLLWAILFFGIVGTLYTCIGGIRAVIWTDTIQIFVVVFAAAFSIYLLLDLIPLSLGEIIAALRDAGGKDKLQVVDLRFKPELNYTLWTGIFAATIVSTGAYGADHDMVQRMLAAKSPLRGGLALIASTALSIPVVLMFMVIGLLLYVYYGRPDLMGVMAPMDVIQDTRKVYPHFLLSHLPTGLKGLAMAGLFAAAMSSFDSAINAMASTAIADIYTPLRKLGNKSELSSWAQRGSVIFMGAMLTLFAMLAVFLQGKNDDNAVVNFALGVMAFAHAPLLGVFCAALFTKRGNNASVLFALAAGSLTVLLLQPYALQAWFDFKLGWPWYIVIAAPLSFLVCVAPPGPAATTRAEVRP